jgi:putative ABC transport system ATP-binding protein
MGVNWPVLLLEAVGKEFKGRAEVLALRDVSLTVDSGESLAITGATGSGKSTLLSILGTLDRPSTGLVQVQGADISQLSDVSVSKLRAKEIGFIFQSFHLLPRLTALANVEEALAYSDSGRAARRELAAAALVDVGLGQRLDHLPSQLSGGEQQRVAIARALVKGPTIVLADEPTGNLDRAAAENILELLAGVGRARAALLVVTHDETIARQFPRVVHLEGGIVVSDSAGRAARD